MPATQKDDERLLAQIRAGEVSALGELYDRYRLQVYRTALAITRDQAAAEDILQECFLRLNGHAHRIDTRLPLPPWLYRVTVNLSYTWVSRIARRQISLEGLIDRLEKMVAPARATPEYQAEMHDVKARVRLAVESLPFNQRAVVVLRYVGQLDLKEIAYILDCPVGTVKSRLHHGREALRARLSHGLGRQATHSLEFAYDSLP